MTFDGREKGRKDASAGLTRILSGGQTGVDRAALDAALELGMSCGGWCPRGRLAEDSTLPVHYPLKETPSSAYEQRTRWNVRDSDGTLVLHRGNPSGGTAFTIQVARQMKKPCLEVDVREAESAGRILDWLMKVRVETLNVAGPRESGEPGIYREAKRLLVQVFRDVLSRATA